MQENLTRKPFILALHDDHAHTLRELRDDETQRVAGGGAFCVETVIYTPDCAEDIEFYCDEI
jgi:hypothetical protein